ncbi:DUF4228 domain protein [Medicago truncatula]|uniref:DUF4228 domain protein n=1 Tax=Medicago truncatula TaxID=3880 RepID=A0A072UZS2_MEDTR|nr:DUF4228 domain protein [Medicago truncatula]
MGNCQAIDAATLVIQHPSGKTEKFYSSLSASQVMKMNPGHCVALLISTTVYPNKDIQNCSKNNNGDTKTNQVRLTRIKLLKPNDTLILGHVYRLITTQEVMKGIREKKQAKIKQNMSHKPDLVKTTLGLEMEKKAKRFDTKDNKVNLNHVFICLCFYSYSNQVWSINIIFANSRFYHWVILND